MTEHSPMKGFLPQPSSDSSAYEEIEADLTKYEIYEKAMVSILVDRLTSLKSKTTTFDNKQIPMYANPKIYFIYILQSKHIRP